MNTPVSALLQYAKREGLRAALSVALTRVERVALRVLSFPGWILFTLQTLGETYTGPLVRASTSPTQKEEALARLLKTMPGGSFLEIGIGEFPNSGRMRLMHELGITYTGLDFARVCDRHKRELAAKQVPLEHIRYLGNTVGTYSWTLFELVEAGEQYDAIYLDGHHTFYIDLPALLLADRLLKPGGMLILDDTAWDLTYLIRNMRRSLAQWTFYHHIYSLSDYTKAQRAKAHIGMIADTLFLKEGSYTKEESGVANDWWVLRKR